MQLRLMLMLIPLLSCGVCVHIVICDESMNYVSYVTSQEVATCRDEKQ